MSNILVDLNKKQLIHPPSWLPTNTMMLQIMGSVAYGVSSHTSDMDVYGFAIPPKQMVFKHLTGWIPGFGPTPPGFDQFQQHHVIDQSAMGGEGREYDFSIFNIVKYFQLCMDNNPNCIDSLFVPQSCVLQITQIGTMVREKRTLFLHKGCWPPFKGYSYSMLHKAKNKLKSQEMKQITKFEQNHNIPHTTTFLDVLKEMKKRNLAT